MVDEDKLSRLRSRVVQNIEHCSECFCKYHCAGDCLTRATDGIRLNDVTNHYRCDINQQLTKDQIVELVCNADGVQLAPELKRTRAVNTPLPGKLPVG